MDGAGDVDMDAEQDGKGSRNPDAEEEREKHRRRAERFGTPFVEPSQRTDPKKKPKGGKDKQKKEKWQKGKNQNAGHRGGARAPLDQCSLEELEARKRRAEKFGPVHEMQPALKKPKISNRPFPERLMFEGRIDADPSLPRRLDTIHVYGVDLMNSKDVLRYFTDHGPKYVEWINDSSCNVVFGDGGSAMRAIVGLGTPVQADGQPNPNVENQDKTDVAMYHWHRGPPFMKAKDAPSIHLMFRMATIQDRRDAGAPKQTRKLWRLPMSMACRIQKWDATEAGKVQPNGEEKQANGTHESTSKKKNLRKRQRRKASKEAKLKKSDADNNDQKEGQRVDDLRELINQLRLSPPTSKKEQQSQLASQIEVPEKDAFTMGTVAEEMEPEGTQGINTDKKASNSLQTDGVQMKVD